MIFIGFIPFLVIMTATVLAIFPERHVQARWMLLLSTVLIASYEVYHGSHHLDDLRELAAW